MSHPLLVFSTLVLRISERYEPEGGGDRPHPPTEPRHIASVSHLRTRGLSPLLADVLTCVLTFVATAITSAIAIAAIEVAGVTSAIATS